MNLTLEVQEVDQDLRLDQILKALPDGLQTFWEDHFSGKQHVWTFFGQSTHEASKPSGRLTSRVGLESLGLDFL